MLNFIYRYYIRLTVVVLVLYTANINWGPHQWPNILKVDARGYYAYLPATFIYGDLNFGFYETVERTDSLTKNNAYHYRVYANHCLLNKYYAGEACMLAPFFLTAHALSYTLGYDTTGYSQLYFIFITIAALGYLWVGLYFLQRFLALFAFSRFTVMTGILSVVFATHLFYYTVGEPGMSHIYSFAAVCTFMYYTARYFISPSQKFLYISIALLALLVLIRPVNILLVLALPFLSRNKKQLAAGVQFAFAHITRPAMAVCIFAGITAIQLIIYKIQTGSFFVYSYTREGFDFTQPHMADFLFSYKKGLFVYTPLCFLALFGLWFIRKNRFLLISITGFLALVVFVLSSWYVWHYGGGFSARVMVEYLPFFIWMVCVLLENTKRTWMRVAVVTGIASITLVNQVQTLQYRYNVIHWTDMTREKYWNVFMDLSPVWERRNQVE